jgi:hypothetical protein
MPESVASSQIVVRELFRMAPSEVYGGVRFEKDGEDNGLNLPMVIIKQTACP